MQCLHVCVLPADLKFCVCPSYRHSCIVRICWYPVPLSATVTLDHRPKCAIWTEFWVFAFPVARRRPSRQTIERSLLLTSTQQAQSVIGQSTRSILECSQLTRAAISCRLPATSIQSFSVLHPTDSKIIMMCAISNTDMSKLAAKVATPRTNLKDHHLCFYVFPTNFKSRVAAW